MKIERITYQKTFPIAQYVNEKIGVEIELSEGDKAEDTLDLAKKIVEGWHKENNPHLYQENGIKQNGKEEVRPYVAAPGAPWGPAVVSVDKDNPVSSLEAIQGAQSLEELKQYKLIASTDPTKALYNAYNQRIKELSI